MPQCFKIIAILLAALSQPNSIIAKEYIAGGDYDYAPFSFIDKTGKPSGLDIEILEAISISSGIKVNFKLSSWDSALTYIDSGEIDIITGIIYSEEREEFLDFTIPIHTDYYSIFIRNNLPLDDLSCLYRYKPAVMDKDVSIDKYLIPMGLYKDYVLAKSLPEALSMIELGLADYVLAPNLLGSQEIEKNRYENIGIKGPSIIPSIYCMAVKMGNSELLNLLNHEISLLRKHGRLTEIQEKWKVFEKEDLKYRRVSEIIGIVFLATITILFVAVAWVWLLRSQIRIKTESINLANQELRKSEEKLRIITENSSDVIWHLDSNFVLTYISQADERIRGFKKEEVLGKPLFSILKPEGIQLLKEANQKRMIDLSNGIQSPPAIYELEELRKDGSWVWVEATATAVYDQNGEISGYHGVSRDISKRKRAEFLLKQREIQLQELNSTKDKLFSIIAHDLRSPFSAILSLSDILIHNTKDSEDTETKAYLELINSSAENTLTLLDNLLSWAKSQTGANSYKPEMTDLTLIINEVIDASKTIAKVKNISIKNKQKDQLLAFADANMVKTILRNLISNAIKFTQSNGEVTISTIHNQNNIDVSVSDNGVGMSEEARSKLFRIDTNITTTGTAEEKGSGLGLVLCKEFVEKHGGTIWVQSELDRGSSFTFSLPRSCGQ